MDFLKEKGEKQKHNAVMHWGKTAGRGQILVSSVQRALVFSGTAVEVGEMDGKNSRATCAADEVQLVFFYPESPSALRELWTELICTGSNVCFHIVTSATPFQNHAPALVVWKFDCISIDSEYSGKAESTFLLLCQADIIISDFLWQCETQTWPQS